MNAEPPITPELIDQHGITPEEYELIKKILADREPNYTELGIFSVMWSEHCSYKNSRPELKKFPTTGPTVLVKAGEENAGVLDIGDNYAVAFKIESHNHPSAVEPFQGAATGVGGIIRDIFTMGARPVANLNSLRFGPIEGDSPQAATNRRLLSGVVAGIAHYGNCIGIPTVGGEVGFDPSYNGNPLVNAFCLGVLRHDQIRRGSATGTGNPVFYVGAKTGRDGLAGAAFASRDLTEESKQDRPAVQVGDPFMEKLLLEACLELFEHPEAVVGVQDMGAAGLTCSTCETASRGNTGIEIDLAKVPQRETGMTPYEIMLSESQERMLIIVAKGHEDTVRAIFEKWDLDAAEIGHVTDTARLIVKNHGEVVADIPARPLADEAPVYHREAREPADFEQRRQLDFAKEIPEPENIRDVANRILSTPGIASKRWVYRQYDHMVQNGHASLPGGDSAVVRIRTGENSFRYLAMTTDCNARYCSLDPREGAKIAVAEAARNIAVTGGEPIAITDNLNFGNPHNPEVFWQLRNAVEGLSEACNAFGTPVTGGNVSLYNQSPSAAIDPTPVVGMVGTIAEETHITRTGFVHSGDAVILIGGPGHEMGGTLYLELIHGQRRGAVPVMDLEKEKAMHEAVRSIIRLGEVHSAHDLSEGGLFVALAEGSLAGEDMGASVELDPSIRLDSTLFNETQGRVLLTTRSENATAMINMLKWKGVEASRIGTVQRGSLELRYGDARITWPLHELRSLYENTLPACMES